MSNNRLGWIQVHTRFSTPDDMLSALRTQNKSSKRWRWKYGKSPLVETGETFKILFGFGRRVYADADAVVTRDINENLREDFNFAFRFDKLDILEDQGIIPPSYEDIGIDKRPYGSLLPLEPHNLEQYEQWKRYHQLREQEARPWGHYEDGKIIDELNKETVDENSIPDFDTGEVIAAGLYQGSRPSCNVIPGFPGRCFDRLDIIIGEKDSFELRVLQGIEHVTFRCADINKVAVLRTTHWEPKVWSKYSDDFRKRGCRVFKKDFGIPNAVRIA